MGCNGIEWDIWDIHLYMDIMGKEWDIIGCLTSKAGIDKSWDRSFTTMVTMVA